MFLDAGDRVPADLRLLHCVALEVDNSALTGETQPEARTAQAEPAEMSSGSF